MSGWPKLRILTIAGVAALFLAATWSTIGFLIYGGQMASNLLAEAAGVSAEIGVVALVVERLMGRHRRQEWSFAYRALARRACETFVDVMRLVYSAGSAAALRANLARYGYFVRLAEHHLSDFRSHIESSATALDPQTHEKYRLVERRLSWCLGELQETPNRPGYRAELLPLLQQTSEILFELLTKDGDGHLQERSVAESCVVRAQSSDSEEPDRIDGLGGRLQAQSHLLDELRFGRRSVSSISQDVDNDFSVPYFMIDYFLLAGSPTASPSRG